MFQGEYGMKNKGMVILIVMFLAGCASAPKPPECKGEYRPINIGHMDKKVQGNSNTKVVRCDEGNLHGNKG